MTDDEFRYISIHAPHAGCDNETPRKAENCNDFNPRTPCGVRRAHECGTCWCRRISIHAPHAGCDGAILSVRYSTSNFNPRTPCGVRQLRTQEKQRAGIFQSTHPMRGATKTFFIGSGILSFQSTHPMRGATQATIRLYRQVRISIHAPHAGCDTLNNCKNKVFCEISIHAPHAGCDNSIKLTFFDSSTFQSTHPMRGATCQSKTSQILVRFQSTHPMRGATIINGKKVWHRIFQSTHPMRGATGTVDGNFKKPQYFNPRTPCGVRPFDAEIAEKFSVISIHAPHAGCDQTSDPAQANACISIHAPHAGCDWDG